MGHSYGNGLQTWTTLGYWRLRIDIIQDDAFSESFFFSLISDNDRLMMVRFVIDYFFPTDGLMSDHVDKVARFHENNTKHYKIIRASSA
jgi:hypothetical protein